MIARFAPYCLFPLLLTGCAGFMSGLDGAEKLSCQMSQGVTCKPMSQVHAESSSAMPAAATGPGAGRSGGVPTRQGAAEARRQGWDEAAPLRTRPDVMRFWVAPWEDADGDLHEGEWIVMRIDDGRWNIRHVRDRLREGLGGGLTPPPNPEPAQAPAPEVKSPAAEVADLLPKSVPAAGKRTEPFFR